MTARQICCEKLGKMTRMFTCIHRPINDYFAITIKRNLLDDLRIHCETCGLNCRARLTKRFQIKAPIGYKCCTVSCGGQLSFFADNTLASEFEVVSPDTDWSTDITLTKTYGSFTYLAAVIDLCSRKVVVWTVQTPQKTDMFLHAVRMAVLRRKAKDKVLSHSD